VDFSEGKKSDTTYVAAVEPVQDKNYYIEEFSGVRCVNCPQGAAKLEELSNMPANKGRLKIVTIHAASFTLPDYTKGSKQDLSSQQGEQLMNLIYNGDMSKPQASIDRLSLFTGTNPLIGPYSQWEGTLNTVKSNYPATPVNIHLSSEYDQNQEAYNIKVKLAYTENVSEPQYLTLLLIEDSIVDNQIVPLIENYTYRHVYRQALTPINGAVILDSLPTKVAGRVYETNYSFKLDLSEGNEFRHKNWNLDNVHIIAFVHNATSGENKRVYHAVDAHLK
jgi:Outer membrane protein Omp28.